MAFDWNIGKTFQAPTQKQPEPKMGLFERLKKGAATVGEATPMKHLGKGLGLVAFRFSKEGRELEQKVRSGTASPEELMAYSDIYAETPTAKQIAGSAIGTAALAGVGTGKVIGGLGGRIFGKAVSPLVSKVAPQAARITATAAKVATPISRIAGKAPAPARLLGRATTGLAKFAKRPLAGGELIGFARQLEEDKSIPESLKKGFNTALAFTAFEGALGGIGLVSRLAGRQLMTAIARYAPKERQKAVLDVATRKNLFGASERMNKSLQKEISQIYEGNINPALDKYKERIFFTKILQEGVNTQKKELGTFGRAVSPSKLISKFNEALGNVSVGLSFKPQNQLTLKEVNNLRIMIDQRLGDKAFRKLLVEQPPLKESLMLLRRTLENTVKSRAPETVPFFQRLTPILATKGALNSMQDKMAGRGAITTMDVITGMMVGAPWFLYQRPMMAIPTIIGAQALRQPTLQINLGTVFNRVGQFTGKPLGLREREALLRIGGQVGKTFSTPTQTPQFPEVPIPQAIPGQQTEIPAPEVLAPESIEPTEPLEIPEQKLPKVEQEEDFEEFFKRIGI